MKLLKNITIILLLICATCALSACGRARILDAGDTPVLGLERSISPSGLLDQVLQAAGSQGKADNADNGETGASAADRRDGASASANAANGTNPDNRVQTRNRTAQSGSPNTNQDAEASSDEALQGQSGSSEGQNGSSSESSSGSGSGNSGSASGSNVDSNTEAGEQGEAQKNSTEESEREQAIQAQLAVVKNELTKADSLRCQAKSAYVELEDDYVVGNRTTAVGQAVALPQITNICFDKYDTASDMWVTDRANNVDIIVKVVPSSVLGPGVQDAGAAQDVLSQITSRVGWSTTNAVRNNAVVLVSSDFVNSEIGMRVLSAYLGAMAYPSMYSTPELQYGNVSALYENIAGEPIDGIYIYPESPQHMEEKAEGSE